MMKRILMVSAILSSMLGPAVAQTVSETQRMIGGASAFAQRSVGGNNRQPTTSGSACNWGGHYADNACVSYDTEDDLGKSHAHCKVCKNGQWYDIPCERRCR